MHSRTVSNGWVNGSKPYQPSMPVPHVWNSDKFAPATDNPEKVRPPNSRPEMFRPQGPVKDNPQTTLSYAPPYTGPPQHTRLPSSPSNNIPAQLPGIHLDASTKLPPMNTPSFPITRQSSVPGSRPGPSTLNKLGSSRSISALADGRHVDHRPNSTLAKSQSTLGLNKWDRNSLQPGLGLPSTASASTSNISGLRSQRASQPSSMLNTKPTQPPPQKIGKPGFFSRLFGFGKSKHNEPTSPQLTKKLRKSTTAARPLSTVSADTTSHNGPHHRAMLVKKPPTIHQTKHGRPPSVLARPGTPSPRKSHDPQPTYPQVGNLESAPTPQVGNYASSFIDLNRMGLNHTTAAKNINPTHPAGIPFSDTYATHHPQGLAATDYTKYPGTDNSYGQYPGYSNARHSGAQDSGYQSLATTPGPTLCTVCNINPQYTQPATGEMSPYCSDACQAAVTAATPQIQPAACSYLGCTRPAAVYPTDHYWNYCSESHESYSRKGCISCRQPDDSGTQLCKKCKERYKGLAPAIIPVPMDHDAFWHVVDKFSDSWANPTQCPIFQAARVYKVMLTQERRDTYLGYRDTLEYYGRYAAKGKFNGNERILWHGTRRGCNLGEPGKGATDMLAGRFGRGIYNFTKALIAGDHSSNNKNVETPWVALILGKVAAGQGCLMRHDNTTLTAPPQGYDSVIAEVRGGFDYDELVVYTYDAIRPTWLVMYQRK